MFRLPRETLVKTAIYNYMKELTEIFVNENYFLYDKSNFIKQIFVTEIKKLLLFMVLLAIFIKKVQTRPRKYFRLMIS